MNELCEVCSELASNVVGDLAETEPIRAEDGRFCRNYRLLEKHRFCARHDRPARVEPFFASTDEEMQWIQAQKG